MMFDKKSPAFWLATWFGSGLIKPAPGTWGTLAAMPFGIGFMVYGGWPLLLIAASSAFVLGLWATHIVQQKTGDHDPSYIVIDEVAGVWLTLAFTTGTPLSFLAAFILFRVFDILKPWPVSWADRQLNGAMSVMLDDILAGGYAALCLIGLKYAGIDF